MVGLGPAAVLLLAVACGFVYWCVATDAGTRWVVQTAVGQLDGQAEDVEGSIWSGVRIGRLDLALPEVTIKAQGLQAHVNWSEFLDHRLHIRLLTADQLELDVPAPPVPAPAAAPFKLPPLPVGIVLDRFALGTLKVQLDGQPIVMSVKDVVASLSTADKGALVSVHHIGLGYESMNMDMDGELKLLDLADPWPMQGRFTLHARGLPSDSLLCARHFVPTIPEGDKENASAEACVVDVQTTVDGSLDALKVVLAAHGQGLTLDGNANLAPRAGFPLRDAMLNLHLPDGSALQAQVEWNRQAAGEEVDDRIQGSIAGTRLNLSELLGSAIPPALLTSTITFDTRLRNQRDLVSADLNVQFDPASRWNRQALSGAIKARITNTAVVSAVPAASLVSATSSTSSTSSTSATSSTSSTSATSSTAATTATTATSAATATATSAAVPAASDLWKFLRLDDVDMDVRLGKNRVRAQGSLGRDASRLKLDLFAPELAAFWPGLAGATTLQGELGGSLAKHHADMKWGYTPTKFVAAPAKSVAAPLVGATPPKPAPTKFSTQSPIQAHIVATGSWGPSGNGPDGWRGKVDLLQANTRGITARLQGPVAISFVPDAVAPAWQWQVGAATVAFELPSKQGFSIQHQGSRGSHGRWETQGAIAQAVISRPVIDELQQIFGAPAGQKADRGGVNNPARRRNDGKQIVLGADWDLKFAGTLGGHARIRRLSGDIIVPGDPGFPLGLQAFTLDVSASRAGAASSRISADLDIRTAKRGRITATGTTTLRTSVGGQLTFDPNDPKTLKLHADMADLSWLSLFLGDATDLGGALQADVQAQSGAHGAWTIQGAVNGQHIRFVRLDDGIRLLDGTLAAHFVNERLILDKLSFPASLRVDPKEWRTSQWLHTDPGAKGGHLTLSGDWDLLKSAGVVNIDLYRYPFLQRSDRYAMVTGALRIDAQVPKIAITGSVVADAGWFDLDMLSSIPTLDSDVVVMRRGETAKVSVPMDISMDLKVDLGPRFYITGYGLDSGLVGSMQILMQGDKLVAEGALRTRGGAILAYGQRLQLRRGTITFQGDIANPVLNIEALRTGVAVEAGVRVAGTAKRPRIGLVSYPDVSDVEKLSWLLLGRGPDQGGSDAALLLSVGTSLLGDGAPFYRQLGLDEVSIQSGELGSTGSLLPVQTVVNDVNNSNDTLEKRFVRASKKLSETITVSLEQALSDTGTVGRLSYTLARGLTADLSVGTTNGIALIYRTIFKD
ncbi:autotransporter secretion inner membrane protein TamB [Paralcaligenes ureilyticus]|uniref:Autotransporter secretion inner membrane protein TamB n=1 Tax=Paralcaligenes ureilyticus TaxID=627131 RepID=A0A4R3MBU7_9BURK|nr:autotransporter secretion inner membrane protein TamB [Paralcaligenes ureilyticus]